VGFLLDGGDPPQASDRVFKAGEEIGRITSGARSYSLERAIAYGYVKRDMNLPGERIEIASCAGMLPGRIVIGSFLRVGEAEAGEGKGGRGGAEGVES
jgi:glycine cleavage system aminomethyltransferase T